jgi:hypothetical protein
LLYPSADRDRATRKKEPGFAAKVIRNKGLRAGFDFLLSVMARDGGELAASYQDAVKAALTLSRPRRWRWNQVSFGHFMPEARA